MKAIKRLNKKLKKYQYIISATGILVTLFGLIAIKIELDNSKLSQREYNNSLSPNWETKLNYLENNVDLKSIQFESLNSSIKLQKVYISYYDKEFNLQTIESLGSVWQINSFDKKLIDLIHSYFTIDTELQQTVGYFSITHIKDCMPISIKFNYVINGAVNESISLYKIHFDLLKLDRVKIKGIELIRNITGKEEEALYDFNCQECIGKFNCQQLQSTSDLYYSDPQYKALMDFVLLAIKEDTVFISTQEKYLAIPRFIKFEHLSNDFNRLIDSVKHFRNAYDSSIIEPFKDIEAFLRLHPPCERFTAKSFQECHWIEVGTRDSWRNLLERLDIKIRNYSLRRRGIRTTYYD